MLAAANDGIEITRLERRFAFSFEAAAVVWSSLIVGLLVALTPRFVPDAAGHERTLVGAGVIGLLLALVIELVYWTFPEFHES